MNGEETDEDKRIKELKLKEDAEMKTNSPIKD